VNAALNLRRNKADRPHDELPSALARGGARAPEISYLRGRYKAEFEAAIRTALRGLGPRDATLLRLHLEQRIGIDQLAVMYKISRATAARWMQRARAALEDGVRAELREKLKLTTSEFDSLAGALLSDLEVSVLAVLGEGKA
jgi:RNA polymerase sigma-70 factor (ECF subfamily)